MSWSSRRLRGSQRGELGSQRIVRKLELIIGTLIFAASGQEVGVAIEQVICMSSMQGMVGITVH